MEGNTEAETAETEMEAGLKTEAHLLFELLECCRRRRHTVCPLLRWQ